ncbi:tail fiber domain-containing protein [Bacteriovoracaceae bacterium]|nr:tail fiber domain-containing protein [Bacteriovoracaceae bacterium]
MIFNKDVGNSGASMVQVMMAFAMVGGLALVMMRINDQGTRTHKSVKARTELKTWLTQISSKYITDGNVCMRNFGPGGANTVLRTNQDNSIGRLVDGDGNPFIQINDLILQNTFQLTQMELLQFNTSSSTNTEGICTLELTFSIQNNAAGVEKIVGAKIQRHPIDFYCSVDTTIENADPGLWHPITNCYPSTTSTHNSLWNLSLILGNEFINWSPSTGLGSVVVGPISPSPIAEPAAVNVNLDGLSLGSATFPFMEGIGFNINSGVSFGPWYFGAENLTGDYMSIRFWDGEEFHNSMVILDSGVRFVEGQDDRFADGTQTNPQKYRGNSVEVAGGVYATQGPYDNPTDFVGFDHMPKGDPILSFGMGPYKSYGAGQDLWTEPTNIGAAWGLRMTGTSAGELYMIMRPYSATPLTGITEVVPNANAPRNFGFRVRHPRNFLFSRDYTFTCNLPLCSDNWIMGDNLGFTGGSDNLILGTNISANNSTMSVLIGDDITLDTPFTNNYSFILANGFDLNAPAAGAVHDYQFIVGGFTHLDGSPTNGNHIFATGRGSADITGNYTFLTGYRNTGTLDGEHATALGVAQTNSPTQHSVGDYPKFTIGPQFSLMSGGGLILQTGWDKWAANNPGNPSRLQLSSARHLLRGSPDDYALIGHNYYRMCDKTPIDNCEYYHQPGATSSYGSSFIYMGDNAVFLGVIGRSGSANEARTEVNNKIGDAALPGFDRDGLFTNDKLVAQTINTDDGQSGSTSDTSDKRLKKNISPVTEQQLSNFKLLKAKTYTLKKKARTQHGFIAQEVKRSFPSLVFKRADGFFSLAYNKMYAFCVKWLQKLFSLLEELESMLEQFELGLQESDKKLQQDLLRSEKAIKELKVGQR